MAKHIHIHLHKTRDADGPAHAPAGSSKGGQFVAGSSAAISHHAKAAAHHEAEHKKIGSPAVRPGAFAQPSPHQHAARLHKEAKEAHEIAKAQSTGPHAAHYAKEAQSWTKSANENSATVHAASQKAPLHKTRDADGPAHAPAGSSKGGQFVSGGGGSGHSTKSLEQLKWYQHHGSKSINKGLREGKLSKNAVAAVEHIDSMFTKSTEPLTVYRGSKWIEGHAAFGVRKGDPKIGDTFSDPAYSSTSKKEGIAKEFTNATVLEVHVPKGHLVLPASELMAKHEGGKSEEDEVLLPRDQKFKITGFERNKGGLLTKVKVTAI